MLAYLRYSALLFCCLSVFFYGRLAGAEEPGGRRVALVIGNSAYRTVPQLPNPENDAEDVSAALRADGFEVIEGKNLDRRGMGEALGRFARAANEADVALFYYAGHGLQFRGENYLLSVDSAPSDEFGIPYELTRVADVTEALNHATGVRILILDACRNNPIADRIARTGKSRDISMSRGLARMPQSEGMVIAYATQANETAADGQGRNSPFTASFVEQLKEPGLEIGQLFRKVAVGVNQRTGGRQTPELSISLLGDFYFNRSETDIQAWARLRDSADLPALQSFLTRFPKSYLTDAARARIDVIERSRREEELRGQLARYEEERKRAAASADAARQEENDRLAREKKERDRLAVEQGITRKAAEEEASRQRAEQERRFKERIAQLEADNRKAKAELDARSEEQARRSKDDADRKQQFQERDRLTSIEAEKLKAAAAEAVRQRSEEDRQISERLAKLEEENRRASAELAARFKSEEEMRKSAERERAELTAALEAERRKATEELRRVERERSEASAREQKSEPQASTPSNQVASLPAAADILTMPSDAIGLARSIASELDRVGCYVGKVDLSWDSEPTRRALKEFGRVARVDVPTEPTGSFLQLLKARGSRVCPMTCRAREVAKDGQCVAKACPRGQKRDAQARCVADPTVRRASLNDAARPRGSDVRSRTHKPASNTGAAGRGRCFNFNGQSFCE